MTLDGPLSFPFFAPALPDAFPVGPGSGARTASAAPVGLEAGGGPVVARQPQRDDATRQRRALDRWSDVANDLGSRGALVQDGPHGWRLRPGLYEEARAPAADDDARDGVKVGDLWVDTAGAAVYCCASAAAGSAVWVLLGVHA